MLKLGEINSLKVDRKTNLGYVLTDSSNEEVFLHNNESNHRELRDNEFVDAFLYFDHKGRVTATLSTPYIDVNSHGFLMVKDVNEHLGVFLDNNISKDFLLSRDDLPVDKDIWPKIGGYLCVTLKLKGKLVAKMLKKEDFKDKADLPLNVGGSYDSFVYNIKSEGITLLTESYNLVFVHKHDIRNTYSLGEKTSVRITNYNGHSYNGSLISKKEDQLYDDAHLILKYLQENNGIMDLTSESDALEIEKVFGISKRAFKRGLGNLYKQKIIDFKDNNTVLVKKVNENE